MGRGSQSLINISSDTILMPDESFIIVRRDDTDTEISISGIANITEVLGIFQRLALRISYVIHSRPILCYQTYLHSESIITEANESNGHLWLSSTNQDLADNIHILESGTWTTYWHDGSNLNAIYACRNFRQKREWQRWCFNRNDFSFIEGSIEELSNPTTGMSW